MNSELTQFEALEKAVETIGGQSAMARLCGMAQPTVWKWLQSSKRLPAEHVLRVEEATGVSRHLLRPDIYPIDLAAPPAFHGVDCGDRRVPFNRSRGMQPEVRA